MNTNFSDHPSHLLRFVLLAALILVLAVVTPQGRALAASLEVIDSKAYPWQSIGRVNRSGYRSLTSCTGTLIAPKLVLTAAHCLFSKRTKRLLPADEVLFIAGVRRDEYAARLEAECLITIDGYQPSARPKLNELSSDIGLIVLKEPSTLPPVPALSLEDSKVLRKSTSFQSVGYRRSRRFLPTVVPACRVVDANSGVWVTDCNTESGASGGPLLVNTVLGPRVAAVMSAKVDDERSVVVPFLEWQELLRAPSCKGSSENTAPLVKRQPSN